jgi:diguanylate cyclase (GGDEF)-like protein
MSMTLTGSAFLPGANPGQFQQSQVLPGRQPVILLADDTPCNLVVLESALGDDYELLVAANGREAVEIALAETPDLILLDVLMPELDGFAACARLKADRRTAEIPVIFVTSLDQVADEARGLELGAIDFISKPFSEPVVKARVRNHIELKRQRDLLALLTFQDGLTGIANRRRFDQFLALEWRRGLRSGRPLSLVLMDLDHFKHYNDALGHLAGDDCLKRVAHAIMQGSGRPGDLAARYGGEEFACVLAETESGGAANVAEHIVRAIRDLAILHPNSAVAKVVTLSAGVATVVPRAGMDVETIIRTADRALYDAKDQGRNRVASAS